MCGNKIIKEAHYSKCNIKERDTIKWLNFTDKGDTLRSMGRGNA